jgi:hypothetical protein
MAKNEAGFGAFKKCRKAAISFFMSVCLSLCTSVLPMKQLGSHWQDFDEILYEKFSKICREILVFVQI